MLAPVPDAIDQRTIRMRTLNAGEERTRSKDDEATNK